jgi:hypothetical protein
MLNLLAFDTEYDSYLVEASYQSIKHKEFLQIVTDENEKKEILRKTALTLTIPHEATLTFHNLFKLTLPNGYFYIAQCLFDFGYPVSTKLTQSSVHKYHFQAVGIASLSIDVGKTLLRRETKTDKILGTFFGNDIDLEGAEKFNDKYYLVSTQKENVPKAFDKHFTSILSKYDNITLKTEDQYMFITFETEMEEDHLRIVEDILSNFQFLRAENRNRC